MKIRVVHLGLCLILLLQIAQIAQISCNSDNKVKSKPKTTTNTKSTESQNKPENLNDKVNSLGHLSTSSKVLSSFPMKVTSCDQVAIFKGKYITDMADYRLRAEGWFSISAYTVNVYKDKETNQLVNSIEIGNIKVLPSQLRGANNCLSVQEGINSEIAICLDKKEELENVKEVMKTYNACRRGGNLKQITPEQLKQMVEVCQSAANDGPVDLTKARDGNKWDEDRVKFHHPQPIKVPGTV